jgi:hypothetical protein
MYLEDLSLEYSPAAEALANVSPGERLLLNAGLTLVFVGVVLLIASGIKALKDRKRFVAPN